MLFKDRADFACWSDCLPYWQDPAAVPQHRSSSNIHQRRRCHPTVFPAWGVQGREFRTARCTPLTTTAITTLKEWLREPGRRGAQALFPNIHGGRLSVDAVQYLIGKYVAIAGERMPSLKQKRVSPHSLRHSAAMELLQAGVECSVIALWLGHESVDTTQVYLHAHLALKEAALARLTPYNGETGNRFQPDDKLLAFLDALWPPQTMPSDRSA
jgi:hypothetical protein